MTYHRKFAQFSAHLTSRNEIILTAIADDGTAWMRFPDSILGLGGAVGWTRIPDLPPNDRRKAQRRGLLGGDWADRDPADHEENSHHYTVLVDRGRLSYEPLAAYKRSLNHNTTKGRRHDD